MNIIDMIENKKFQHYFLLYSSVFVVSLIISIIIGYMNINMYHGTVYFLKNFTSLRFADDGMIYILVNNFIISMLLMYNFYISKDDKFKKFVGVFYFLYMGTIAGLLISGVTIKYNLMIALSLVVPHGIIEIPAIIYAVSSGWAMSELRVKGQKSRREFVYSSMIIFCLLVLSAYIESNITMSIYNKVVLLYN